MFVCRADNTRRIGECEKRCFLQYVCAVEGICCMSMDKREREEKDETFLFFLFDDDFVNFILLRSRMARRHLADT